MTEEYHQQEPATTGQEIWDAWAAENPWYADDVEMRTYADRMSERVKGDGPSLDDRVFYDRVAELVRERYPSAFMDQEEPPEIPVEESAAEPQEGLNGAGASTGPAEEQAPRKPRAERSRAISNMTAASFNSWRERLGLSQCETARQLGVSERQIGYYAHGKKPIPYLDALAMEALERRKRDEKSWEAFCLHGRAYGINVEELAASRAGNGEGNEQSAAT